MLLELVHSPLADMLRTEHRARQARIWAAGAREENRLRAIREEAQQLREGNERAIAEAAAEASRVARKKLDAFHAEVDLGRRALGCGPSIRKIIVAVALAYQVRPIDIMSALRTHGGPAGPDIITPRHVSMYLAKTMTLRSLPDIGRQFGGRDHTTVLHGVRKTAARMAIDDEFRGRIEALRAEIEGQELQHEGKAMT